MTSIRYQCNEFSMAGGGMQDYSLYSAILGLSSKWRILNAAVDEPSGDIEIYIRFRKGSKFSCRSCGALKLPSSSSKTRWLHENHLNIRFYISALIPIISCEQCGDLKAEIPWEQAAKPCSEHEQCDENHCKSQTAHFLF